jgi:hypothetical protein
VAVPRGAKLATDEQTGAMLLSDPSDQRIARIWKICGIYCGTSSWITPTSSSRTQSLFWSGKQGVMVWCGRANVAMFETRFPFSDPETETQRFLPTAEQPMLWSETLRS